MKKLLIIVLFTISSTLFSFAQEISTDIKLQTIELQAFPHEQNNIKSLVTDLTSLPTNDTFEFNILYSEDGIYITTNVIMNYIRMADAAGRVYYDGPIPEQTDCFISGSFNDGLYIIIIKGKNFEFKVKVIIKDKKAQAIMLT